MTRRMRFPNPSAPSEHDWMPVCDLASYGCVEVKPRQMLLLPSSKHTHDYDPECDRAGCFEADAVKRERSKTTTPRRMVMAIPGTDGWEHNWTPICDRRGQCVPLDEVEVVEAVSAGAAGPGPESDTELLVRFRKALYDMAEFLGSDLTVHGKDGSRLLSSSDVSADGERDYRFSGGRS